MLTATYSLVAIAVEQRETLYRLERIGQALQGLLQPPWQADADRVARLLLGLSRFDCYCHERKVEKYVIPAVRGASREIDAVVGELESLSGSGLQWLRAAAGHVQQLADRHAVQARELSRAMEAYCDCLRQRLQREEELLFPLVRRLLSGEEWFALAAKFLGDEQRRHTPRATLA